MANEVENLEETEEEGEVVDKKSTFFSKSRLRKVFRTLEKVIGVIIILFILGYTPFLIYDVIQEGGEVITYDNIYRFPMVIKSLEKGVFRTKEFNITLDTTPKGGNSVIVKTEVYLAYNKDHYDLEEELEGRKKELEDRIQFIISSKALYDINSADKREYGLKKELINEVNSLLGSGKVEDLYFASFFFTEIKRL